MSQSWKSYILGQIMFAVWSVPCTVGCSASLTSTDQLDDSSTSLVVTIKNVSRHCQRSAEGKIITSWDSCSKSPISKYSWPNCFFSSVKYDFALTTVCKWLNGRTAIFKWPNPMVYLQSHFLDIWLCQWFLLIETSFFNSFLDHSPWCSSISLAGSSSSSTLLLNSTNLTFPWKFRSTFMTPTN